MSVKKENQENIRFIGHSSSIFNRLFLYHSNHDHDAFMKAEVNLFQWILKCHLLLTESIESLPKAPTKGQ